ncbi:MAG: two-component regulator propeller domain-containing protein, partial [Bacteroidales bacterium]
TQFTASGTGPNTIPSDSINTLYSDRLGFIWIGTNGGLIKLNPKTLQFRYLEHNPRDFTTLSSNQVTAICEDAKGRIWIGTQNGLNLLNEGHASVMRLPDDRLPTSLPGSPVTCLASDSAGNIWIGTPYGLMRSKGPESPFERVPFTTASGVNRQPQEDFITTIFVDEKNQVWAGTRETGIYLYDPATGRFVDLQAKIPDAGLFKAISILTMTQDRCGLYWVGTSHKGLVKLIPDPHAFYQIISGYSTFGIIEPYPDEIWCGTRNGVLVWNRNLKSTQLSKADNSNPNGLTSNLINGLYDDGQYIWVMTEEGLNRIRKDNRRNRKFRSDGTENSIAGNIVWHVMKDSRGDYWFSTTTGLSRWNPESNRLTNYFRNPGNKNSLSNNTCYQVFEHLPGRYLISTQYGLNEFNPDENTWKVYLPSPEDPATISTEYVFGVYRDNQDRLWVYTNGGGFNRFDPENGTFQRFTTTEGLSDNTVYGMHQDQDGIFWLPTNNGLSRYDPVNERFSSFNVQEGLLSNEFNLNSLYATGTGEIFLGGINGVNAFQPQTTLRSTREPVLRLTEFTVHDEAGSFEIHFTDTIRLTHRQNTFSVSFSVLDFLNPFKNQYSCFLENFDKDITRLPPGIRQVDYRNVPPGHYLLRIKGANSRGVASEDLLIPLIIVPAWHQTAWFRILLALTIIAVVGLLIYSRLRIVRNRHEIEKRLLTTQTELVNSQKFALRSQMNPHFIFNSLNSIQNFVLKNDVDSANYYLSNFSTLMRKVLDYSQHNLILLAEEIELIHLYLQMEHMRFSKKFDIEIKVDPAIDQFLVKIPPMLLQPYLENAVLHGLPLIKHKGLLQVLIDHHDDHMLIRIIDNGIGRERARAIRAKTGHKSKGLANIEKRIKLYNKINDNQLEVKIIDLHNPEGQPAGTCVEIIVPYDIEEPSTEII